MVNIGAVDLFCGVGGLTYGLQKAGLKVVAGIDLDQSCKYAFEKNNKSKFINKSVTEVTGTEINKLLNGYEVKVIVGCAPCQPFSSHRKDKFNRKGHKDWGLLYEFLRLIKESDVDIISMENVPALEKEIVFHDFINDLKKLGYYVQYSIVDISEYGVAQSRKRLILLASKYKELNLLAPKSKRKKTVKQVIGKLPPLKAGEVHEKDLLHRCSRLSTKNLERIRHSKANSTWRDWPEHLLLECHKKESGKFYSSVYGRMGWDTLAPTITTQFNSYGTGRFGHPEQDRAISLREGAMLQSFPKSYDFIEDKNNIVMSDIARQIGNAVPPKLGQIIGKSILIAEKRLIESERI